MLFSLRTFFQGITFAGATAFVPKVSAIPGAKSRGVGPGRHRQRGRTSPILLVSIISKSRR
jgi:hypothetical protein